MIRFIECILFLIVANVFFVIWTLNWTLGTINKIIKPSPQTSFNIIPKHQVSVELLVNGTVEVISKSPQTDPIGLFFIAHACTHSARDFWLPSLSCEQCLGLSEEVRIARFALEKGFVVFAVTSMDRVSGCWSNADTNKVRQVVDVMRQRYAVNRYLPLFSFGASSGGSFVWGQAIRGEVDGAIIQIMSVNAQRRISKVPIIFSSMPRDTTTAIAMHTDSIALNKIYPNNSIYEECLPLRVTSVYLLDRVDGLSPPTASFIVDVLKRYNHISNKPHVAIPENSEVQLWGLNGKFSSEGYLIKDPTQSDWRDSLTYEAAKSQHTRQILQGLVLTRGRSPLAKALHRAWAHHEYCSDHIKENLEWLQQRFIFLSKMEGKSTDGK